MKRVDLAALRLRGGGRTDGRGRLRGVDRPLRRSANDRRPPVPLPAYHGLPQRPAAPPPGDGPVLQGHAG